MLLDTCTFLWAVSEPDRLSANAKRVCDDPHTTLKLSVVSVWEILLKAQKGLLQIPGPIVEWCRREAGGLDAGWLPLQERHLDRLESLPQIHKDPFDRLLIAQSLSEGWPIVTCDETIAKYPNVSVVW